MHMPKAPAVPLHGENLDRAIQRRNRLIKRGASFSAAASAAYIAAGAALGSFSIIAGGTLYLAAAWVEYSFKQANRRLARASNHEAPGNLSFTRRGCCDAIPRRLAVLSPFLLLLPFAPDYSKPFRPISPR